MAYGSFTRYVLKNVLAFLYMREFHLDNHRDFHRRSRVVRFVVRNRQGKDMTVAHLVLQTLRQKAVVRFPGRTARA